MRRLLTSLVLMGGILVGPLEAAAQEPPPAYPAPPIHEPAPSPGQAQVLTPPRQRQTTRITRPNAVYVELLGRGFIYGVGYDHTLFKWLGLGGSFSYFKLGEVSTVFINPYANFYPVGGQRNSLLMQLGTSFAYFGHRHDFFMPVWDQDEGFDFSASIGIGYEYRRAFLFRVMLYGLFSEEGIYPWLGFTFGGAF